MKYINRNLVIIYAKQELLDWVIENKPHLFRWTLKNINDDPCAYLINIEDQNCQGNSLEMHYREILENELGRLYIERDHWPKNMDYELFCKWFKYTYHTEVCDLLPDVGIEA